MNNYWSIGTDANVALEFHKKREKNPKLFTSPVMNKVMLIFFVYLLFLVMLKKRQASFFQLLVHWIKLFH